MDHQAAVVREHTSTLHVQPKPSLTRRFIVHSEFNFLFYPHEPSSVNYWGVPLRASRVTVFFSHGNVGDGIRRLNRVLRCRSCRRWGLEGGGREEERIRRPSRAEIGMARYMPGCPLGVIYDIYSVRILNPIAAYSKTHSSLQYHFSYDLG